MHYGNWTLGIGDPTPIGWLTVAGYVAASALCLLCALRARKGGTAAKREFAVWGLLGAAMLALGINKQLDLQSLLTEIGRHIARNQGWYKERREAQYVFVALAGVGGAALFLWFVWQGRSLFRKQLPALVGLLLLAVFVLVRAASFHHVDAFLGREHLGISLEWVIELSGIGCVAAGALRQFFRQQPQDIPFANVPDL